MASYLTVPVSKGPPRLIRIPGPVLPRYPPPQHHYEKLPSAGRSRFPMDLFYERPDDEFICSVCQDVLDNPLMTPCGHTFCGVCITKVEPKSVRLGNGRTVRQKACPNCREGFADSGLQSPSLALQNLLKKLQMRCPHEGCGMSVTLEAYCNHEDQCDFAPVSCPYQNCPESLIRIDLEQHMVNCDYRPVHCPLSCNMTIQFRDLDFHCNNNCEYGWRTCEKCEEKYNNQMRHHHDCIKYLVAKLKKVNEEMATKSSEMASVKSELASMKSMMSDMAKQMREIKDAASLFQNVS